MCRDFHTAEWIWKMDNVRNILIILVFLMYDISYTLSTGVNIHRREERIEVI